ncbi:MAG: hypothetical protein ABSG78_00245 [Verrucomicrobiota bacterium]
MKKTTQTNGVVEWWSGGARKHQRSVGVLEYWDFLPITPPLHHSTRRLHHSIAPLHHPITPSR